MADNTDLWNTNPLNISDLTVGKEILAEKNISIEYSDLYEVPVGRFTVLRNYVCMHTLYIPSESSDILFVVLDGARSRAGKIADVPKFDMWSWQKRLNVNYLSIEDPMYFKYVDPILSTGWYYGDESTDYREYVSDLLMKICSILNFPADKVVIYGLSAGGTAAGFVASRFLGCTAIMNNPQINFLKYKNSQKFIDITGLDIIFESTNGRRNDLVSRIKEKPESLYLFMFNAQSREDIECHFAFLLEKCGCPKVKYGLNKLDDNIYAFIYSAKGCPSAHTTTPPHFC